MLQWISDQYGTWTEQLSAAVSAIGPLRLTKGQLFRLFMRKTMHDLHLHLNDLAGPTWAPVVLATLLALMVGSLLLLTLRVTKSSPLGSRGDKLQLPMLRMHKGWDYPTLLEEGAKRYPNTPYIITYSGYEYVVFPSSCFDEVKRLNASRASMVDWFTQVFWQGWTFLGTDNSARYHTVGIDLARALPSRVWMRQDNAEAAFEAVLGPRGTMKDWKTVSLWGTVQKVVALMNATGLLGPELVVDSRWLKATQRLHTALMIGIVGSHLTPRLLRPIVAPIVFLPAKLVDLHMKWLLLPMVQRELDAYQAKEAYPGHGSSTHTMSHTALSDRDGSSGTISTGSAQRSIKEKFPLTEWLLDRYRSHHGRLNHLLRDHIVIAFEAATTSSGMLYFLLAELAARPELVGELREELARNTDESGHLPLTYLAELQKMDSFMLESARVTGSSHCTFNLGFPAISEVHTEGWQSVHNGDLLTIWSAPCNLAVALFRRVQKPLKLSIGPELPPGTLICVDAYHAAKSQTEYKNAATLDPLRFHKMRQKPGHEEMHQFTVPGPNNTIWGGGTQACPGRPFASITMKVVLAHLLTHYDIQLLPGGASKPKRNSMPNGSISPDTKAKIMLRDRQRL